MFFSRNSEYTPAKAEDSAISTINMSPMYKLCVPCEGWQAEEATSTAGVLRTSCAQPPSTTERHRQLHPLYLQQAFQFRRTPRYR